MFAPNANITNAEYFTILMKATQAGVYPKVSPTAHWGGGVMVAAYKAGVVKSDEITGEQYNKPITRKAMALYTERALELIMKEPVLSTTNIENLIHDFSKIDNTKYEESIRQIYARGIIGGDAKSNFNPDSNATRAEAATIILKSITPVERKDISKIDISSPVWEAKLDSAVVITEGNYKGFMKEDVATKYDLEALKTSKFYTDAKGQCYVSINLAQLPQGFKWDGTLIVHDKAGNTIIYDDAALTGKTGLVTIKAEELTKSAVSKIADASISVKVLRADSRYYTVMHKLSTDALNKVFRQGDASSDYNFENFDTSKIFLWGK